MENLKRLALKVAMEDDFHQKLKVLSNAQPHKLKTSELKFLEAMKEFEIAASSLSDKEKEELLRWGQEVVHTRDELYESFRESPAFKLRQVLVGYNISWCFLGYGKSGKRSIEGSSIYQMGINELVQYLLNSPEREQAMDALTALANAVQIWSLSLLVDIRMAANEVERKDQSSFSRAEVLEILSSIID